MPNQQTSSIQVHLPLSVKADAVHLAEVQNLALSAWVRGLIVKEIKASNDKRRRIMEKRRLRNRVDA